ncbi:DNA repair protein REV1 [Salmo trutta]|uniref:DNA repair protein REV1 n=1 Tax=Salmo trutta TaxID=8032 RepID=UPI001132925F|nr:DNA repair protein REV1-like [Salmo trutta]
MAAKVSKLDEQLKLDAPREKPKDGACSSIFTGVAIYVNGYTEPSVDELRRLMNLHGGQFHVYYSHSNTTHIIATNLPNSKIQELRDQKVVRPEWITDSIKAGHLLSYLQYQLYAKQKGLSFPSVSVHQGQEPAGPLHGHLLPSHSLPLPSLNNHNPAPSLGQPLSRHHTPTSSHSHLHTDNLHHQPNHYNPLASHLSPQPSHSLPSHLGPQPSNSPTSHLGPQPSNSPTSHLATSAPSPVQAQFNSAPSPLGPQPSHLGPQPSHLGPQPSHLILGPSLLGPFSSNHLYSDPGHITHHPPRHGKPKLGCIQPPPSAYTHPQTPGPVPANPSHKLSKPGQAQPPSILCISSHLQHSYRELDFRLNGSLLTSYEKTGSVKMNWVQELGGEDPCQNSQRGEGPHSDQRSRPSCEWCHKASGPLPTRPTPTTDRGLPHTLQSIPPQPDSPLSKPPIQHDTPRPPPVSHHRHHAQPANEQRPKPPPPTYQEAMAASASRPLDLPPQSDFPPEKPLPPANPNPSPSPVCLNGSHHNVFPSNPTPLETNNLSANAFPSNSAPLETNNLSANTFPSNPTPLETNNLSANAFPSNPAPLETNNLSANAFPSNPTPLETNNLSANAFPSNPTPLETNNLSANAFPSNPAPLETNNLSANAFPSNPTPLETNNLSANAFPSNPAPLETNNLSANAFPSNPTPLETNNLSANPFPSNSAPPQHDQQSAKVKTGGIISEFYSHSRLHHISTWRSEFSEYVNMLQSRRRATGGTTFPGRDRLRRQRREGLSAAPGPQSCILHVDMDCFFVSVGIRHRPDLKGKSVAVTSNRGSGRVAQRPGVDRQLELQYYQKKYDYPAVSERKDGDLEEITSSETESHISHGNSVDQGTAALSMAEIASCSYEARQAGVRNGMFFGQAKQLCPSLQSVPYDFQAYKKVALAMYETLASYSHDIEALSCDEALVDSSALLAELSVTPDELASAIRADVRERTGCSASVGMGSNILLARMATRKAKPNGQYFLRSEEVDDFIRDQTVTSLPGVGRSMGGKLASLGVRSCGDLQQVSLQRLQKEFGPRTGQTLFRFCRGLDDRPVRSEKERKSVSAEMNYNIRFTQVDEAESFLTNLSIEVQKRLQWAGLRGRRLTLKVMVCKAGAPLEPSKYSGHGTCDNLARSVTLAQLTDCGHLIASEVIKLFHTMRLKVQDMRVGLQVQLLKGGPLRPQGPLVYSLPNTAITDTCTNQEKSSSARVLPPFSTPCPTSPAEPIPGTTQVSQDTCCMCVHVCLCPCQVDRSVLEALPAELREQVEHSWTHRHTERTHNRSHQHPLHPYPSSPGPSSPLSSCSSSPLPSPPPLAAPPVGALVIQIPNQPGQTGSTGIILELPDFSLVDPEVFAALPRELQEELRSAYGRRENAQAQGIMADQRNPLLHLKHVGVGRMKRCYKKNANNSPAKKGPSPLKRPRPPGNSPAKDLPHVLRSRDLPNGLKLETGPSTSSLQQDDPETLSKFTPRPEPTLAGACDFMDIRTLIREWVTTISDPMEEDILQEIKYCTDLINDKNLEKIDLIIKYMKRLMQQSVESVWSMAFDFILDNVQVVVQQTYGSSLKIT